MERGESGESGVECDGGERMERVSGKEVKCVSGERVECEIGVCE